MELLTLAITGAVVSGIVGLIKAKFGTSGWKSVLALVIVSLVGGLAYFLIKDTAFLQSSVEVLISANLIYTLLFKQLKK